MRYKINSIFNKLLNQQLLVLILFCNLTDVYADSADMTLTVPMLDSQVILQTSAEFGGAISSLVFRDKEYIDHRDHGRLLQSASSFENYGECFNPTEGGGRFDTRGESSSQFKEGHVENNQLWTLTDMAFWLLPNQAYPNGCGLHKDITQAINTTITSGHLLEKKVTVGLSDFPNVIEYKSTFRVPNTFSFGVFEATAAYIPKEFSLALFFNPIAQIETDASNQKGEQSLPVILATPDRNYAIGVYSKDLPQNGLGYGHNSFPDVNKWNCVFREHNVQAKPYQYTCLIILGTVDEVEQTMQRLAH